MTCDAASRPAPMNSVKVDRRTPPLATLASNRSALFRKAEATVRPVPNGGVEFVSDARHQPSQRGQLFGLYEAVLRGAEILERLRQLPCALLDLGEQPRVLDGDHRLTGEGFQELDLRLGK